MFILCDSCPFGIRVDGDELDVEGLVGDSSPHAQGLCPDCAVGSLKRGKFADNAALSGRAIRTLSPMEAHLLLEGMGYPEERDCVVEIFTQELTSKRIRKIDAYTAPGTTRTVLNTLELEDGTTIFFSGSAVGALAYRIRKPNPYQVNT